MIMREQRAVASRLFWLLVGLVLMGLGQAGMALAQSVCAEVMIEIKQKLSLERQAFDAQMRISNGLTDAALQNIAVALVFQDESGNGVVATSDPGNAAASFFVAAPTLSGINAIDGSGSVAPKTAGQIDWLIIPAPGTGGTQPQGKLYFVGATLTYTLAGKTTTVNVLPDSIVVKPQPMLTLDYFLAGDVYADDAFTPETEPPVPFTLGVRVRNTGGGSAPGTAIESAQPRIVENVQGLLIGFQILDSYIDDQPADKTLLLNLGDISPGTARTGRWNMATTLSGKFVDFGASYTHADSLGGALTSLIQTINTHLLVHDVKTDLPGRDNVRDFLAIDGSTLRLYESDGTDNTVTDQSAGATLGGSGSAYALTFPATTGFAYAKVTDPGAGRSQPGAVVRSDGKRLAEENVWLSKKRNADLSWSYYLNLFDANTTGRYEVALGGATNYALLAGTVFNDANGNGQRDAGEAGLGTVGINLSGTEAQGVNVVRTAVTDATGVFRFADLNAGTYSVQVGALSGFTDGLATPGTAGGTPGIAGVSAISLEGGASATGYAFAKRAGTSPGNDLALAMSANPIQVKTGDIVSFQLVASNGGPATASAIQVTNTLPDGLVFVSAAGSPGAFSPGTGQWVLGDLPAGGSGTLDIAARVNAVGSLTNRATITSTAVDPNPANNAASATVTGTGGNSDLRIGVLSGEFRLTPGETGSVLATASNFGPDPAAAARIDLATSGLTVEAGIPSIGTYDAAGKVWSIPSLASGASANLVLRVANAADGARLGAVLSQINGAPPAAAVQSEVILNPAMCDCGDLALMLSPSASSAQTGSSVDWTVVATNRGANPAPSAIATLPLPVSLTLAGADASKGSFDAGAAQWKIGTLFPGDSATLVLHTAVNAGTATTLGGTLAAVNGAQLPYAELVSHDNGAQASLNAAPATAQMRLAQSADIARPAAGESVTILLSVANDGPLAASGATVVDRLPGGLSFVSATPTQGTYDATNGLWHVGVLGVGAVAELAIKATAAAASPTVNSALAYADQIDTVPADNVARLYFNRSVSDVALTLGADNPGALPGQSVNLTIGAESRGPDGATALRASAALPPGLALAGALPSQGSFDAVTGLWTVGSLAAHAKATLVLSASVGTAGPQEVVARLHEAASHDGNSDNNEARLTLSAGQAAILSAAVTTDRASYRPGDVVLVKANVANGGSAAATGVLVNAAVTNSVGTRIRSGSQTIANIAAGEAASVTFSFAIGAEGPGTYAVSVDGADLAGNAIPAATAQYVVAAAQGAITGTVFNDGNANGVRDAAEGGIAGAALRLVGTNAAGAAVSRAATSDGTGGFAFRSLEAGLYEIQATPPAGHVATGAVVGSAGGTAGASGVIGIVLAADVEAGGYLFGERAVGSPGADLAVALSASTAHPLHNDTVILTLNASNAGPATATGVTVKQLLPAGLSFVWSNPSVGLYNILSGDWTVGDLASGGSASLAVGAQVATLASVTDTASVSAAVADPNPANNSASVTIFPVPAAALATRSFPTAQNRVLAFVSCNAADGDAQCAAGRAAYLDTYLGTLGYDHMVVTDADEFRAQLRCGHFNSYWVSGAGAEQIDVFATELQEAVRRGEALLIDGVSSVNGSALQDAAGVEFHGTLSLANPLVTVTGGNFTSGTFAPVGVARRLAPTTARVEAAFSGRHSPAALAVNAFGSGHAVTMGFDLLGTLQAQPTTPAVADLPAAAFRIALPALDANYPGGALVPFRTEIQNLGDTIDLQVVATPSAGATLAGPVSAPGVRAGERITWDFRLPGGATQPLDAALRLPFETGTAQANIAVYRREANGLTRYNTHVLDIPVFAGNQLAPQTLAAVQALAPHSRSEQKARDRAITVLQGAQLRMADGRFAGAIKRYLTAIDALGRIGSANTDSQKKAISRLIEEAGRRWCMRLPACEPAANAPGAFDGTGFGAYGEAEGLAVRGGGPAAHNPEWALGSNLERNSRFVANHLEWRSGKNYAWRLTYDGQGNGTYAVSDGSQPLFANTYTAANPRHALRSGNALEFGVASSAHAGVASIRVAVETINGHAVAGMLATAGSGEVDRQSLHYYSPALAAGFTAQGTVGLLFTGNRPPHGDALQFTVNSGYSACYAAER